MISGLRNFTSRIVFLTYLIMDSSMKAVVDFTGSSLVNVLNSRNATKFHVESINAKCTDPAV
jgi:hypothetical protein